MIIYVAKDDNIQNETIWISQYLMTNINIFKEKRFDKESVIKNFLTTANDGKNCNVLYYNLEYKQQDKYYEKNLYFLEIFSI